MHVQLFISRVFRVCDNVPFEGLDNFFRIFDSKRAGRKRFSLTFLLRHLQLRTRLKILWHHRNSFRSFFSTSFCLTGSHCFVCFFLPIVWPREQITFKFTFTRTTTRKRPLKTACQFLCWIVLALASHSLSSDIAISSWVKKEMFLIPPPDLIG